MRAPPVPADPVPPIEAGNSRVLALDRLYAAHAEDVARWVARLYGPGPDVEDLVHDVFYQAGRRLSQFRGDSKASTWLFAIARHTVAKRRRRDRLRRLIFGQSRVPAELVHAASEHGPFEALATREIVQRLYAALDTLPEAYRTPLVLFEIEEMPAERIAELLEVTPNTIWIRLHRARQRVLAEFARAEEQSEAQRGGLGLGKGRPA